MKVQLDLCNYTTKADLKKTTGAYTSKMVDLASLKSEADQLDIDKLEKVPTGLSSFKSKADKVDIDKLVPIPTDVVKNHVVNKDLYNAKIKDIEVKIPNITN